MQHPLHSIIKGNKKNDHTSLRWDQSTEDAFEKCRLSLMLSHPSSNYHLSSMHRIWQQALHSIKLSIINQNRLVFSQKSSLRRNEITAHTTGSLSRCSLQSRLAQRPLILHTYWSQPAHICIALPEKASPRQINHLTFISQYTTDIRHIKGENNDTADIFFQIFYCSNSCSIMYHSCHLNVFFIAISIKGLHALLVSDTYIANGITLVQYFCVRQLLCGILIRLRSWLNWAAWPTSWAVTLRWSVPIWLASWKEVIIGCWLWGSGKWFPLFVEFRPISLASIG